MAQKKRITLSTARARKRFVQTLENSVINGGKPVGKLEIWLKF